MRILSIDSATKVMGVGVWQEDKLLAEANLNVGKTHSQRLLPLISHLLNSADIDLQTIDAVAVTIGPGSFTGLRIGIATAKAIAVALNVEVIPIKTLDALAYNGKGYDCLICPILDARKNEVYFGIYDCFAQPLEPMAAMEPLLLAAYLKENYLTDPQAKVMFLGDGADVYFEAINQILPGQAVLAPAEKRLFMSGSTGLLAWANQEKALHPQAVKAFYLRASEAENKKKAELKAKATEK